MSARARRWSLAWVAVLCVGSVALAQAPAGGAALGSGLTPPTAARYADPAWYDLLDARWATGEDGATALELELAVIDPDAPLLQPIVEAYLMDGEGAGRRSLPGTGLGVPDDAGWAVAVRVAGGGAWAWTPSFDAPLGARSLRFEIVGRTVRIAWPADLPVDGSWVAVSGVYDPFSETGWRPFAAETSPWAFSGPAGTPPVVSVVPGGADALLRLHATALLPTGAARGPLAPVSAWWWWMGVGMVLVAVGLTWRGGRSPWPAAPRPAAAADALERPALIGDDDVVAVTEDAEGRQLGGAARSRSAATAPSEAATDADVGMEDASSSARTTRAPSDTRRSAKRS